MLFIDVKYANLLGARLRNFKQKDDYVWSYSCPVCGDSKKNKLKARGYIYRAKQDLFVKCHNCQYSSDLGNFIKAINQTVYEKYVIERYKQSNDNLNLPHTDIGSIIRF